MGVVAGFFTALVLFVTPTFAATPRARRRRQRGQPAAPGPRADGHPPAAAVPRLRRLPGAVRLRRQRAARCASAGPAGCCARRSWALVAWVFLTAGIVIGGWWSYDVLGWGGYWAWDPVENASFLPWLVGTAYLHSAVMQARRGMLPAWSVGLVMSTFVFTLLGTFLARSGVIASVHAFSAVVARSGAARLPAGHRRGRRLPVRHPAARRRHRSPAAVAGQPRGRVPAEQPAAGHVRRRRADRHRLPDRRRGVRRRPHLGRPAVLRRVRRVDLARPAGGDVHRRGHPRTGAPTCGRCGVTCACRCRSASAPPRRSSSFAGLRAPYVIVVVVLSDDDRRHGRPRAGRRGAPAHRPPRLACAALGGALRARPGFWGGQLAHVGLAIVALGIAASANLAQRSTVTLAPGDTVAASGYSITYVHPSARSRRRRTRPAGAVFRVSRGGESRSMQPRVPPVPEPGAAGRRAGGVDVDARRRRLPVAALARRERRRPPRLPLSVAVADLGRRADLRGGRGAEHRAAPGPPARRAVVDRRHAAASGDSTRCGT